MPTNKLTNSITNYTCNGNCSNCGECCSNFLPLDEIEIYKIRQYIKKHNIKEQIHVPLISNVQDATCPFRDNDKKICTIYKVRPAICRSFICSKSMQDIEKTKQSMYKQKQAISMRKTFFNKGKDYIEFLIDMQQELTHQDKDKGE